MANKGLVAFKEFTAGVVATITDPDQRRKAEESLTVMEQIAPLAQALGDGVAGQSEIDRQLQTLKTQQEELDTKKAELDAQDARLATWKDDLSNWYSENKALIDDARAKKGAKPDGDPNPALKAGEVPAGVLTEDRYNEKIAAERAGFLGFSRDQNLITREHYTRFSEIVDLEPLLTHPQIGKIGLVGVYELVHKDRLDDWKKKQDASAEEKIRADERQKVQASMAQMPYPSPTGTGSGSPLDALTVGKKDALTDEATAHYNRLQAERAGAGAR